MLYLVAILLPAVAMLLAGRPLVALIALILQVTLIGWVPAAIWALFVVNEKKADRRAMKHGGS